MAIGTTLGNLGNPVEYCAESKTPNLPHHHPQISEAWGRSCSFGADTAMTAWRARFQISVGQRSYFLNDTSTFPQSLDGYLDTNGVHSKPNSRVHAANETSLTRW
jgi:hypothetical protein